MKQVLLMVILFSCAQVVAQEDSITYYQGKPTFATMAKAIKISPFDIISITPTLGVDFEVQVSPTHHMQAGIGFLPSSMQVLVGANDERNFDAMRGYKLRYESRLFIRKNPKKYFAAEMSFRHLIISDNIGYGMEGDGDGNFAYFKHADMKFHRFTTAINFKMGRQKVYDNGFLWEYYWGLSLRRNFVSSSSDLPSGVENPYDQRAPNNLDWSLVNGHQGGYVTPIVGLRVGYVFQETKKKRVSF